MLLGIDLGTGSVKALLLSIAGEILAEASQTYAVQSPQPGWAESDPGEW
jgi:xylulokinase